MLIDDQYQPWLMEVNFAPSLTADSALDYTVKSKVLVDMLNIAGIRKSPSAATTVPTATSKVPVKKHMHASYVANILNSATSNTANNSNITNDDLIRFHFHGDYEHRDAYTSAVTDFPEEADTGGDEIDDFVKQMEKLVWTQFKDELSQGIEKKMIMQFLQERQRVMRSNNQFKLIYPIEEKYSQYQKFFSVDRLNNEILGRFVFFLHQYSQLNQPVSNEDLAMTSTQSKKIKKTKSVSKTKKKLLLHTIYSQQYAGLYQRPSSATSRNVKADSTVPSTTTKEDHEHHALPPKAKARPHSAVKSSSNSNFHVSHQFQESQSNNSSKLPTPRNHPHDQSHEDNTPDDDNEHVAKGQVDEQQLHQPVQYEFKVDMWNQIHNRWARAMGRSTATSRR